MNSSGGSQGEPPPSPPTIATPPKKFSGDIKGSNEPQPAASPQGAEAAVADADREPNGQMSERQALALLQSVQDEEARIPLDERRPVRPVYNDW